jgi:DNA-binding FadR family transcriptional regulator
MSNHLQTEVYIRNTSGLDDLGSEGFDMGHQAILDAVCSGDSDLAERAMRDHIGPADPELLPQR